MMSAAHQLAFIFVLLLGSSSWAQTAPPAASSAPASAAATKPAAASLDQRAAAVACERAAQETLQTGRRAARSVSFTAAPSVAPGPSDASELVVRGAGRMVPASGTAARPFSYSCNYDVEQRKVAGVVVRDRGGPEPVAVPKTVEPDLSRLSPGACESAAAAALQRRWPGVSQIAFNGDTRQLTQNADGRAQLRSQGTALPQVGGPSVHFSYDCAVDAGSGRVLGVQFSS
jgi:hypothetical protein